MGLITDRKPSYSSSRAKQTIEFCDIPKRSIVLDIGEANQLSKEMEVAKNIEIVNTVSDLDYQIVPYIDIESYYNITIKYVTCFEVIEHLLNPRWFFDYLHNITDDNVVVYLSYPSRPKIMWNNEEHFHEYDRLRFNYLLKKTGFKIVRQKKIYVRIKPNGIRPLLRNFIPQTIIYELHKI